MNTKKYKVLKLSFCGPLHLGASNDELSSSSSALQSDTLSAALGAMLGKRGASSEDIRSFMDSFAISSAFPYYGNMLFLPVPFGNESVRISGQEPYQYRKKLKKVKYAESGIWNRMAEGKSFDVSADQVCGEFLIPSSESAKRISVFKDTVVQRVSVSRSFDDAVPFFFKWRYFAEGCGLYCVLDCDESVYAKVLDLMILLGEDGLGTDKSVGGGQFTVEEDTIDILSVEEPNGYELLSMFIPSNIDGTSIDFNASQFAVVTRGGYSSGSSNPEYRHFLKRSIRTLTPGSVIVSSSVPVGTIVDLSPSGIFPPIHPVYRSGKALAIPICINDVI